MFIATYNNVWPKFVLIDAFLWVCWTSMVGHACSSLLDMVSQWRDLHKRVLMRDVYFRSELVM